MAKPVLEANRPRPDIREKVTGAAKYAADKFPKGVLYAKFVRAPFANAKIEKADVDAARAVPGVVEVDINLKKPLPYCGARAGYIAADSREAIADAIAALKIKFARGSCKSDAEAEYPGPTEPDAGRRKKLDELFAGAAAVVEATYRSQVQTHSCLEPHGSMVDHRGTDVEAWVSTQTVMGAHGQLAGVAQLDPSKVTVHCEYVGGGFGSKFSIGPWGSLAANLSAKHKRPVRIVLDRKEEHVDGGNRPGSIQYMKIAADKDGKLLGGQIDIASIVGWQPGAGGAANPSLYKFGDASVEKWEIALGAGLPEAFRAPGWPQGIFAVESLMDELAAKLGLDPLEFRRRNETSDRRRQQMDTGAKLIGWAARKPDGSGTGRIRRGIGYGGTTWFNTPGACAADVDIFRNGTVELRCGVQDIGTGTNAVAVAVVADELHIDASKVVSKLGNSQYPPGPGSGGSFVSRTAAPAFRDAAAKCFAKLRSAVAAAWGKAPGEVDYAGGQFAEQGGTRKLGFADACALINGEKLSAQGEYQAKYFGEGTSDGCQFAEVEVDTETGIVRVLKVVAIQACGVVANKMTAENQVYGGVIQGVSFALFEDRRLDRRDGGMVNADFINYKIAGSADIPEIVCVLDATEADTGVRSLGEPCTIPTAAAIANAVANAIGKRVRTLPITPQRVLEALG